MSRDIAREIGVADRVNVEPDLIAFGDDRLVRFVLLNLIENAVKFSPNGGAIRVGKSGGAFFVADDGIGFEPQYAEKIFKPFERLVRDDEYPGTGIGLANAHRIVKRHGGKIWADAEPGKGATFYFTLPVGGLMG
jgi:signal transduction histidine kinase